MSLTDHLIGVMQSFFQLVLDRELGNDANGVPYQLHPETRVIAAINCGSEYTVEEMDPALLRRDFGLLILNLQRMTSLIGLQIKLDSVLIDFIRQHPEHLRVDPGSVESGTVCPNPASWHRLNDALCSR